MCDNFTFCVIYLHHPQCLEASDLQLKTNKWTTNSCATIFKNPKCSDQKNRRGTTVTRFVLQFVLLQCGHIQTAYQIQCIRSDKLSKNPIQYLLNEYWTVAKDQIISSYFNCVWIDLRTTMLLFVVCCPHHDDCNHKSSDTDQVNLIWKQLCDPLVATLQNKHTNNQITEYISSHDPDLQMSLYT